MESALKKSPYNPQKTQLLQVLDRLCLFHTVRGNLQTALEIGEQLLSLSTHQEDVARLVSSHSAIGQILVRLGDFRQARVHGEQAMTLYHQHRPSGYARDAGVVRTHFLLSQALWRLGYPDQALQRSAESLTFAQELDDPFIFVIMRHYAALVHCARREPDEAHALAERVIVQATEYGFAQWVALGMAVRGWALTTKGQIEEGIMQLREGLSALQTTGSGFSHAGFLRWLAEAYGKAGQPEEGLRLLDASQTLAPNVLTE